MDDNDLNIPSTFYRVSVKALVFDAQKRLLVIQNDLGLWEIPGGGCEHGESLEGCLRRELGEELGVAISRVDQSVAHPSLANWPDGYPLLRLAVSVQLADQAFRLGDGTQAAKYVTANEFMKLPMHPADSWEDAEVSRLWNAA